MKKLHLLFILILSCTVTFAQTLSVETKSVSISAGTVSVDVSVAGLTAVKYFSFRLDFDHTILSNPTFTNRLVIPNTSTEFLFGRFDHVWSYWDRNPYTGVEAIPDGVLFTVTFDIIGSVGDIAALTFTDDDWTNSSYQTNSFASNTAGSITVTAALPVELTAFNAQSHQENVLLNWSTATEENNAGFDVERSADGENWEVLDFVLGHGTTLEAQNYLYEDTDPLYGESYYRLRQVDYDGAFEYSDVVSVDYETDGYQNIKLEIFPNPVVKQFTIQNATGQLTIYNSTGQPVLTEFMNRGNAQISMEHLPAGQYVIEVLRENGERVVERIVKQ